MNVRSIGIATSLLVAAFAIACGGSGRRSGFGTDTDPTVGAGDEKGGFTNEGPGQGSECGINNTDGDPDKDYDGDGFPLKDDCNECNTSINKGAYDIPGNGVDEDCSGTPDDEEVECDDGLSKSGSDPFDGAKAIGLCKKADPNGTSWGVVEAKWVRPDGSSLSNKVGVGILEKFGVNAPQLGASMLALSSGKAAEGAPVTTDKGYSHGTPAGYPKESPACPGVKTGQARDGVALELTIRVPTNAQSFSYQQNFFTQEYPDFICNKFNDFFVTMMNPVPAGLADGNIAFDQDTNPISVNNSLLQVCEPGTHGPTPQTEKTFDCPLGVGMLSGTGFEGAAATGWLTTSAPVTPGSEITLLFAIWDSQDGWLDSTVLIDDFKFSVDGADTATKPSEVK
ncbi:MAG: hypothetical protein BGO98_06635 [Myxococcales bacterium 68-20]|nr:MAG: hypothetical protein BGO98_06635 [Myxococcales bacterium 68-20]